MGKFCKRDTKQNGKPEEESDSIKDIMSSRGLDQILSVVQCKRAMASYGQAMDQWPPKASTQVTLVKSIQAEDEKMEISFSILCTLYFLFHSIFSGENIQNHELIAYLIYRSLV